MGGVYLSLAPYFLEEHALIPWLSILDSSFPILVISNGGYEATPLQTVRVPLLVGRSILHQRGRQTLLFFQTQGLLTHFTHPLFLFGVAYHDPILSIGCIPLGVHYPPASMGIDIIPSTLHTHSFQGLQPHHITCGLHPTSVDTPVDVHGRSCNFPFFHPREALLVGCWVTTLPLSSCGILFLSPLTEVVLHGLRLVHMSHV